MGHLIRSFSLARALADTFRVVFLNGGPLPAGLTPPDGVDMVDLPPLGMRDDKQLCSRAAGYSVEEAQRIRRQCILAQYNLHQPQVILIELFPFGRKKFAGELLPLLRAARRQQPHPPLILCSLRDLLVSSRRDQQRHDDRAAWLVKRYFDGVLVHADPAFAQLEASFKPRKELAKPVYYTGFVLPQRHPAPGSQRERRVVVSAGGGMVGAPLFRAAIEAHTQLWDTLQLPMTLVAGPFLPTADWAELQTLAHNLPGLELLRSVPDLGRLMHRAAISVSQCGYNTSMDILYANVAAIVVPFAAAGEDEQTRRARRLEHLGLLRMLPPEALNGSNLAAMIHSATQAQPRRDGLDLDGARRTQHLISDLLGTAPTTPPSLHVFDRG
jgi:predicted glycosyltransferase